MQGHKAFYYLTFLFSFLVSQAAALPEFATTLQAAEDSPALELNVSPNEIYEGESARLTVSVINGKLDAPLDFKELENDFVVEKLNSSNRSSITITNSRRVEIRTVDYHFLLTPKHAGVFTIDPPEANVDGNTLESSPVTLKVNAQTETDLVVLEQRVTPSGSIYPLVPFEVSVDVYIKAYPEKFAEYDPLSLVVHNLDAPQLNVPWLESPMFEDRLVADPLDEWLSDLSSTKYGFSLNNYRQSDSVFDFGFSFFNEPVRKSYFMPKPEEVERPDSSGNNAKYWKYSFTRKMRASEPGDLAFSPATLKGAFLDFADAENPVSRPVFLSTQPVELQIKEIPTEDAPENYVGIYGKIKQNATLSANEASVGDAINLTLEYSGYGSYNSAVAPEISELDGIKDVFRVYPATERSIDSGVAFDYKLRPLKEGTFSFPAIQTSFFNVESGEFETLRSEPVQIVVKEGVLANDPDEDQSGVDEAASDSKTNSPTEESLGEKAAEFRQIALNVVYAIVLIAVVVALAFMGRSALRANAQRIASSNRRILASARSELESGLTKLDANAYEGFSAIRLAFLHLVGKRLRNPLDSYTDAEIQEFLDHEFAKDVEKSPETEETLNKLKGFFQKSEEIRFGGASSLDANFKSNVRSLFEQWTQILLLRTRKLSTLARDPEKK